MQCQKCDTNRFEYGEMRATGGFWSKIFDVQGLKFKSVICRKCGYTEFYKDASSKNKSLLGNIFDFFT